MYATNWGWRIYSELGAERNFWGNMARTEYMTSCPSNTTWKAFDFDIDDWVNFSVVAKKTDEPTVTKPTTKPATTKPSTTKPTTTKTTTTSTMISTTLELSSQIKIKARF